jgi:hypothetical protein
MASTEPTAVPSLDSVVTNNIGRAVAFVLTPILLPVMGGLSFWLQDKLGINMDPAIATGFVVSIVVGVALAGYKWLHNRGEYERAVIELNKLHQAGQQATPAAAPRRLEPDT